MKVNVLGLALKLIKMFIMSVIHNFEMSAKRPVINQLELMLTITGLKTTKTVICSLFVVWSGLLTSEKNADQLEPLAITKPDWIRLYGAMEGGGAMEGH